VLCIEEVAIPQPLFPDVAVAPEQTANGIDDVHSASGEIAGNGGAYNT